MVGVMVEAALLITWLVAIGACIESGAANLRDALRAMERLADAP
jgi:hypothetical protein